MKKEKFDIKMIKYNLLILIKNKIKKVNLKILKY